MDRLRLPSCSASDHMTRIAIYGGSFNPPTIGHQQVAAHLSQSGLVDRIWVCPAYTHPFGKDLAPYEHRLTMCFHAFQGIPNVDVGDAEREAFLAGGKGYTLDLICFLKSDANPSLKDAEFFLVLGSDILQDLPRWVGHEELFREVTPIIVGRKGFRTREHIPANAITLFDLPIPEVSSTQVRECVASNRPMTGLVPPEVEDYIKFHVLY